MLISMVGYTLAYNTLDNNKNPTAGIYAEFKQDFAGVGGDVNFIRTTADARSYYEMFSDVVARAALARRPYRRLGRQGPAHAGSFPDGTKPGARLRAVRHRSARLAPRGHGFGDPLGGTMYWGASLEAQAPFSFLPKEAGLKGAVFADAGSLWNYKGPTSLERDRRNSDARARRCRDPGIGRRRLDLEFAVRSAALRLFVPADEAGLRPHPGNSASAAARNSKARTRALQPADRGVRTSLRRQTGCDRAGDLLLRRPRGRRGHERRDA